MTKKPSKYSLLERQRRKLILPFLLPALLVYGTFTLYPAATTFVVSALDWNGVTAPEWVGPANYLRLGDDGLFMRSVGNTVLFTVLGALILFPVAMFLGYVTQRIRFGGVYRFMILAPIALSVTTAALMWKFLVDPTFGAIPELLRFVGLDDLAGFEVLGRPQTAMLMVVLVSIWHGVGIWMLYFSAAYARVPEDVKEAARLDGASAWQVFWHIVWPLIWEVTRTLLILWVIQAFQTFTFVIALTNGGPLGATEVVGTYLYRVAFGSREFGYAGAIAVALFLTILVLTLVSQRLTRRERTTY
ncbi:carbohydrate ABC transporter permease [Microcella sp.]|uniref:carbohydrate ABC transporter permease n=1 Tax=Microcella sp. TaxID=1913979 RepID=UPI002564226B|nr:sugar ABC transporter permease [Microcella sp.]MBX9471927.1 sugar ABC transporter permease [Microcella sp.]